MKATLEFYLPSESEEHMAAIKGIDYRNALLLIDEYLQGKLASDLSSDEEDAILDVQDRLVEICESVEIDL